MEAAPLLLLPETGPVVLRLLRGVQGTLLDAGCGANPAVAMALAREPGRPSSPSTSAPERSVWPWHGTASRRALLGVVGDVEALPFRPGAFAGGVCDDTIEHLPDDHRGANELGRVLAPGGRMVVATPNRRGLGVLRHTLSDRARRRPRPASAYFAAESHLREYTWRELIGLLERHVVVASRANVGWSGGWHRRFVSRLVALPGLRALSRMLVVVVQPRRGAQAGNPTPSAAPS